MWKRVTQLTTSAPASAPAILPTVKPSTFKKELLDASAVGIHENDSSEGAKRRDGEHDRRNAIHFLVKRKKNKAEYSS